MVKGDGRERAWTYIDDVESLVDRGLGVERESSIDLGGDLAGDDLQDLGAELNEEVVESRFDLGIEVTTLRLGLSNGVVDQGRILGLLGSGEDEGGVGGGILRLVLANGCEVVLANTGCSRTGQGRGVRRGVSTNRQSHQSR